MTKSEDISEIQRVLCSSSLQVKEGNNLFVKHGNYWMLADNPILWRTVDPDPDLSEVRIVTKDPLMLEEAKTLIQQKQGEIDDTI